MCNVIVGLRLRSPRALWAATIVALTAVLLAFTAQRVVGMQCTDCAGLCPAGCDGSANWYSYPTTGCPSNARNNGGWCCNAHTPIVIDVDGAGFVLTSLSDGVVFDIAARGKREQISWTASESSNAWLALDRNGNGVIDNGAELFGDATPQPDPPEGQHRNGFLALAVFDRPENGGNGNGLLDDKDEVFAKLLLWQDKNHDGVSQPEELKHLSDFGIAAIDLRYWLSNYTDQYDNIFRYKSKIDRSAGAHDGRFAYDVLLLIGPQPSSAPQSVSSKP